MKHNTIIAILGFCIFVLAIGFGYTLSKQQPINVQSVKSEQKITDTTPKASEITLATSTIKNFGGIYESLGQTMDSYRFYKANWVHIVRVDVNGKMLYVGEIEKVYGNGVIDKNPMPLFLYDGILYTPQGYGGETYPLKDTNWSYRYKKMDISQYMPIENYGSINLDMEGLEMLKIKVGIDNISITSDVNGQPTMIEVTLRGQEQKIRGVGELVQPVNLITRPEFAGAEDYQTLINKSRRLAGNVTGNVVYTLDTGYKIEYPERLNGKKVIIIDQGNHNYSFNIEDKQYDPDVATLYCNENDAQQLGPQTGIPTTIALESRSKLIDWGISKEYLSDAFSFTGPGYHCEIRATQAFRLDMFKITF